MRVAIVGAGAVGRSIAGELLANGHQVMLIEKDGRKVRTRSVPGAEWVQADACEVTSLEEAQLATCDVVVAATGDDKANLVVSLLAKTEFAVQPRRRPGQGPPQRVALHRGVGRRRRRLHPARARRAGRGGGDRRRRRPADRASARARRTWSRSPSPRTPRGSAGRCATCRCPARRCSPRPARRAGDHPVARTSRWRPATSCCSSPTPRSRSSSSRSSPPSGGAAGPARRVRLARARWRCSRATTHRLTTSATAVTGSPARSDQCAEQADVVAAVERALHHHPGDEGDAPEQGQPGVGAHHPAVLAPVPLGLRVRPARVVLRARAPARRRRGGRTGRPAREPVPAMAPRWLGARNSAITPTSGQRTSDRDQQHQADGGVAHDAEHEEVAGLAGHRRDRHRDADAEQPADRLLDALPAHQPQHEDDQGAARRRPRCRPTARDGVGDDERDRRHRRVDHPAPAAELVEHQVPVERVSAGRAVAVVPALRVPRCRSRRASRHPAPSSYQGL